jgi:hypothetical protein
MPLFAKGSGQGTSEATSEMEGRVARHYRLQDGMDLILGSCDTTLRASPQKMLKALLTMPTKEIRGRPMSSLPLLTLPYATRRSEGRLTIMLDLLGSLHNHPLTYRKT